MTNFSKIPSVSDQSEKKKIVPYLADIIVQGKFLSSVSLLCLTFGPLNAIRQRACLLNRIRPNVLLLRKASD